MPHLAGWHEAGGSLEMGTLDFGQSGDQTAAPSISFLRQGSLMRTSTEVIQGFATVGAQAQISLTNGPEKEKPV